MNSSWTDQFISFFLVCLPFQSLNLDTTKSHLSPENLATSEIAHGGGGGVWMLYAEKQS